MVQITLKSVQSLVLKLLTRKEMPIFFHHFWPILAIFDQFFPLIWFTVGYIWYMFTQGRARNGVHAELMITGGAAVKTERQTK